MTLYTPYSAEEIFYPVAWVQGKQHKTVEISGIQMEIEVMEDGEARIVRIVSSNPADYLHQGFQPGNILKISF